MSSSAVLPMASVAGMNQFERDRLARIAMNEARMRELMQSVDTSLIIKQPSASKAKALGAKKRKAAASDQDIRRSSRIHNIPVPLYCIEEDPTDCPSRSRRYSTTPGPKGPNGRRCHGAAAAGAALFGGQADPYMAPPLGWKQECGSAGLAAAEAATDAALALVQQLAKEGRPAVVKLMSASQVSGGFWCQLPIDLAPHYGTDKQQHKRTLTLHCFDKAQQDPEDFMNAQPGSSTAWPVVLLPRGEGSGLSGGWRGFAIDQRIFPNDTVVFACLDAEPTAPAAPAASTAAADGQGAAKSPSHTAGNEEGSGSDSAAVAAEQQQQQQQRQEEFPSDGGSAAASVPATVVKPHQRMHMQAYIFRAYDYEDSTKQQQQQLLHQPPTPQQAADAAALGRMGSLTPSASSQPQQQQQQGEDQLYDDTAADEDGAQDALADVPLAKRAKYLVAGPDAALQQQQQPPMSPEQQAVQQLGLMEAAEAGVLRVKVARQGSSSSSSSIAGKSPAAAAAAAGSRQLPQEEAVAAAAGGVRRKRQGGNVAAADSAATAAAPRQRRAAAAAASKAWGVAPRNSASNSSISSKASGSSSSKPKAAGGVKLVPKPADPTQLVPAPSKAELASGCGGSSYEVESILAHRVNATTGGDEFLISWRGYGPYWDSWEGRHCLEGAPGSYTWQGGKSAIPRKFRL